MKIRRLRLVNFRQHVETDLDLGDGITGVIGPNGSGKTTLLEALAWALYGPRAARGDKDSIRNYRAKPRAAVRVELEFDLGRHAYRVVRGLHDAELHQDGQVVANSIKEVTDKLGRALGMTYDEFLNTYFTGQKELTVMAHLGRTERGAFLSRVLGYDRLQVAQERVRERRNTETAELRGLEAGLPPPEALAADRRAAEARLEDARRAADEAADARGRAEVALGREQPRWQEWSERRERTLSLDGERRMAEQAVVSARQEFQRLDKELAEALTAKTQLDGLRGQLAPIEDLKRDLAAHEALWREETARRGETAQLDELRRGMATLERRLTALAPASEGLDAVERELADLERRVQEADRAVEEERTAWARDRQDAETKRLALREQWREVKDQKDAIQRLGPEGTCPTCQRPLGAEYERVLGVLDRQLEDITINGNFFKQRVEQLAGEPPRLREAEAARDAAAAARARAAERAGASRAQVDERARASAELETGRARAAELERRLGARRTGYDAARHDALRRELARLEPVTLEAAALQARAGRAEILAKEAELAEHALSQHERRASQLEAVVRAEGFSEDAYRAAKARHDRALHELRVAEVRLAEMRGELTGAEAAVREAERREHERAARGRAIGELRLRVRLHNELDRAFSDLRGELNAAMRPEIADLASGFLADLTDGRYDGFELGEDYEVTVLESGVPKPVISGGEQDLANLVLRLAISQMIAERAGQPLSLLVLDEIFGSLDDARRQSVLALLRRLGDRFPQVILISHIEQVREGLDRVIRVEYDPARGTSVVRDETATIGATDAGVAA